MYKTRFPAYTISKLQPWGDKPFQIFKKSNNNAYKVYLPSEYAVNTTFNIYDIFLFNVDDNSRSNPFKERGNNTDQPANIKDGENQ